MRDQKRERVRVEEIVAAYGWKEYLAQGRGAILIQRFGDPEGEFVYLPLDALKAHSLDSDYVRAVEAYDPLMEVVCLMDGPAGQINGWMMRPKQGTPPQVYERIKTLFNFG